MSYTITVEGWRTDGYAVHGKDDATGELVRVAVTAQQHKALIDFLREGAKAGWPNPKIEVYDDAAILTRRHMTLGDYGYNND